MLTMFVTSVKDYRMEAEAFYYLCKRDTTLNDENTILVAKSGDEVVGIVRLCLENECHVLRTMQVHPNYQRQGIGLKMIDRYKLLLEDRKIDTVYCMPYAHLERFYGMIGFKKIIESSAPQFLQERVIATRLKKPNEAVILMKR